MSLPPLPADPVARLNTLHQLLSLGRPQVAVHEEHRYRASLTLPPWVLNLVAIGCAGDNHQAMQKKVEVLAKGKLVGRSSLAKVEAAKAGCEVLEMLVRKGELTVRGRRNNHHGGHAGAGGGTGDGGIREARRERRATAEETMRRVKAEGTARVRGPAKRTREVQDHDDAAHDDGTAAPAPRLAKRARVVKMEADSDDDGKEEKG